MEFSELIRARHSVRYFDEKKPVPEETLRAIVQDASRAPSCMNAQEWRVWVATGEVLERIRRRYAESFAGNAKADPGFGTVPIRLWSEGAQRRIAAFQKSRADAGLAEVKLASQSQLFHAPAVAYLTVPKVHAECTAFDIGGHEVMMRLAAADRGVGSVPAYNLVKFPDILREELGIPETEVFAVGIAFGYEVDCPLNRFRSTRMPPDDFAVLRK